MVLARFMLYLNTIDGFDNAGLKGFVRPVTKFAGDFFRVNRIAQVVSGAVFDKGYQLGVFLPSLRGRRSSRIAHIAWVISIFVSSLCPPTL